MRAWGWGVPLVLWASFVWGREAEVFPLRLGSSSRSLWGSVRPGRFGCPGWVGCYRWFTKKVWFCRNLLASRHPATEEVCFCRVFVPQYMIFLQVALFMRIMIFYKIWWGTLIYENLMTNDIQKPRRATFSLCFLLFCVFLCDLWDIMKMKIMYNQKTWNNSQKTHDLKNRSREQVKKSKKDCLF